MLPECYRPGIGWGRREALILGQLEEAGRMLHAAGVSLHVAQGRLCVSG